LTQPDLPGQGAPDAPSPASDTAAAEGGTPPGALQRDGDLPALDPDGQPRLTLFGLERRAVPAVYLVGWIASLTGVGAIAVSIMGSANPFARWLFVVGLVILAIGLLAAAGSQTIERSRRAASPFKGPSPVLAFAVVVVISLLALLLVLVPVSALGVDPGGQLGTAISLAVTTTVFLLVVRQLVVRTGALSWAEIGFSRPLGGALADLGRGALLAVPVLAVSLLLTSLLAGLLAPPTSPLPTATTAGALLLNLLSAAVLAPLGEEVFFRGYTTTAWARAVGARSAILRGALFFALAHIATLFSSDFGTGWASAATQFVGLLPAGLVLGWVFLARRSIWAPMGLHAAFNALQLLLLFAITARG